MKFARFMTNPDSQMILLDQAGRIPININVNTAGYPLNNIFIEQANTGTVIPNVAGVEPVFKWGDMVYDIIIFVFK